MKVRVLVRDEINRVYYGEDAQWVTDPLVARDFCTLQNAGQQARSELERAVSVVLAYEDPKCELALNPTYCV